MRTKPGLFLIGSVALFVAGCTNGGVMSASDNWGEANRQTMAAQIIDPDPQYDTAIPASSGDHAADAVERYNKDQVKKPDRVRTTTINSSGSGGGSGGSGGN